MWLWINFLLSLIALTRSEITGQILSGAWTVSYGESRKFTVYAEHGLDSYSALKKSGFIGDPLSGLHDTEYRWVSSKNWTFTHTFRAQSSLGAEVVNELVWNELDTFCQVSFNNVILGQVSNSFLYRSWVIGNLAPASKDNILKLECISTNRVAKQIANSMKAPPPPDCWPSMFHGECHINLVRTTQASFGWDWGPAFPIQGFWQPPQLIRSYRGCRFGRGFKFFPSITNASKIATNNLISSSELVLWNADISVEVLFNSALSEKIRRFCIGFAMDNLITSPVVRCFTRFLITSSADVPLTLFTNRTGVTPWWPNRIVTGPHTYQLHLNLTTTDGKILDRITHTVGFRQFELVERPVQSGDLRQGLSFYFRVNGLPVFAKGANWIPSRLLPGRSTGHMKLNEPTGESSAKQLLASAAAAGLNVIRIWGGGRYEPDWFYEEADRLGLMIWHDMMFAVATYTAWDPRSSVDTVEQEVRMQIRRLHSHPSVVIWATDNEVKQAVNDGWYRPARDRILLKNFKRRFVDLIARVIYDEERPNSIDLMFTGAGTYLYQPRRCLISSPSNGIVTEELKGMDLNPQDTHYGDVHYYIYSGNLWSERNYPITRFTSEFGIQSLPTPLAWKRSLDNESTDWANWNIRGSLMSHRQHHSTGLALFRLAAEHLGRPAEVSDPVMHYSRWAYLTQVNQLMAYRTHINLLMRHQCRLVLPDGRTHTAEERTSMGAIYWQLNDVWSAPSWSTIDAAGQWKMAHYGAVRECFSNTLTGRLSAQVVSDTVEVDWIPPDQPEHMTLRPDQIRVRCLTIDSFEPIMEWVEDIHWPLQNTTCPVAVMNASTSALITQCSLTKVPRPHALIHLDMLLKKQVTLSGGTTLLLDLPAKIDQWPAESGYRGIRIEDIELVSPSTRSTRWPVPWEPSVVFKLRVISRSPELFVWLELNPSLDVQYWFDQNAFHLLDSNGLVVRLYVLLDHPINAEEIRSALRFHSLSTTRQA